MIFAFKFRNLFPHLIVLRVKDTKMPNNNQDFYKNNYNIYINLSKWSKKFVFQFYKTN